ncbi:MAG: MFS transporter [Candidatus Nanopelagicales bacterium]
MPTHHGISRSGRASASSLLTRDQRRVLAGVCIVVGASTTVPASYNFVVVPMLEGLGASETQNSILRELPSIAGLLVIFLAGTLGQRWGERRFITRCGILFTVGNAAVLVAPVMAVAVAGLVLESIGATGFIVVGLALLSARVSDERARASAFSTYGTVGPIVYLVVPLLAGALLDFGNWRLVAAVWALSGLVILVASRTYLPAAEGPRESRELLTPALAGVLMAAAVQTLNALNRDGLLSVSAMVRLGIVALGSAALFWALRHVESPSLSLAALGQGGMYLLLIIVILMSFANLWFYMTVGLQYLYGLNAFETALALLPAQAAAIAGAVITRWLLRRRGITVAGSVMLLGLAMSLLLSALISSGSPLWVPLVLTCFYAVTSVGAGIPLTNAVMDLAPQGEEGSASAFRSAAGNIGGAVGVIVMTTIVFGAFSASLASALEDEGLNSQQSVQIAETIRDGVTSEDVAANYAVPLQQVEQIADAQREAMIDGLRAHGVSGAAFTGVCLVIFVWSRRKQEQDSVGSVAAADTK